MIFTIDTYDFEIIFNADDIVINVNDNENIKMKNNFFSDYNIIKLVLNVYNMEI